MTNNITTYYIPQNLNITKGRIYNLYINKVKNLDLSSIVKQNKEEHISISKKDINQIIELLNDQKKLYIQAQEIEKKLIKERK